MSEWPKAGCAKIQKQHKRERWFRHLSVSVTAKHKYPNEVAVLELMKLFGFRGGFDDSLVRDEDLGQGMHAINVLQPEKEESDVDS